MTTNLPFGVPDILFESKEVAQAFAKNTLSPKHLRTEEARQSINSGEVSKDFMRGASGLAFYNSY